VLNCVKIHLFGVWLWLSSWRMDCWTCSVWRLCFSVTVVNYCTFARNDIVVCIAYCGRELFFFEVSNRTKKKHTARCPLGEPRIYPIEICTTWIASFLILMLGAYKVQDTSVRIQTYVCTRRHYAWENQTRLLSWRQWELNKGVCILVAHIRKMPTCMRSFSL
jgi:hypothetical protein